MAKSYNLTSDSDTDKGFTNASFYHSTSDLNDLKPSRSLLTSRVRTRFGVRWMPDLAFGTKGRNQRTWTGNWATKDEGRKAGPWVWAFGRKVR